MISVRVSTCGCCNNDDTYELDRRGLNRSKQSQHTKNPIRNTQNTHNEQIQRKKGACNCPAANNNRTVQTTTGSDGVYVLRFLVAVGGSAAAAAVVVALSDSVTAAEAAAAEPPDCCDCGFDGVSPFSGSERCKYFSSIEYPCFLYSFCAVSLVLAVASSSSCAPVSIPYCLAASSSADPAPHLRAVGDTNKSLSNSTDLRLSEENSGYLHKPTTNQSTNHQNQFS